MEGGGAKGAFQVGAYRALTEMGITIDGVTGASIGAINGALIAQGDGDKLYRFWENVTPSEIMNIDDDKFANWVNRNYDRKTVLYMAKRVGAAIRGGGIRTDKMLALLDRLLDEKKLKASPCDYGLVTVSLTDRRPLEIFKDEMPEGTLRDFVFASAYFPAFKRNLLGGKSYIDGGIYDNMPINPLVRRGYDEIIAVRTMSNMPHQKVIDPTVKITYIKPSEPLGKTLSFTNEGIRKNMELGYYDTMRLYKGYLGRKYYFLPEEDFLNQIAACCPKSCVKKVCDCLGVEGDAKGMLYILSAHLAPAYPMVSEPANLLIQALEGYAVALDLKRFCVWNLMTFLGAVRDKLTENVKHPVLTGKTEEAFRAFVMGSTAE